MKCLSLIIALCLFSPNALFADNSMNVINPNNMINHTSNFFMRTGNNNVVYISPSEYLDIDKMSVIALDLPGTIDGYECHYWRPPFSNNKIPVTLNDANDYSFDPGRLYLYDLTSKSIAQANDVSIWSLFPDSDRNYLLFSMQTTEWWFGNLSWSTLWLMRKDGSLLQRDIDAGPQEYILSEFNGTIFDNEYIMETIRTINETRANIISRNEVVFYQGRQSDQNGDNEIVVMRYGERSNSFFYFVNRMEAFFNTGIHERFDFEETGFPLIESNIGIYENGFFIFEENKIMLLDIGRLETKIYTLNGIPQDFNDSLSNYSQVFITNDGNTLLLRMYYSKTKESAIFRYKL
jgi:hypothetical protein